MAKHIINEEFLQQIETLQILIKNNVAGMFGGNHQSKTFGSSCEFADYRDYIPGDDITKIDWNAYARFEKFYLKLYLDERQMHTRIYIDASRSMEYGKSKKDEQALRIAATLAYLSVCEMDKVSVYAIRDRHAEEIISSMLGKESYFNEIGKLNEIAFQGDSHISEAILPSQVGYGDGISVLISDFLTDHNFEDAVNYLIGKRRDVFCVQILSKEELNPKARGKLHFFDSENSDLSYRKNINKEIIRAYQKALEYATGRIRELCYSRGAEYMLAAADDSATELFYRKFVEAEVLK
ncbi:MAG: DUF58 domain-containing protein [Clostridia bacterium]|jgi:hypothetical protein|nr:DUF58 domain-containing protein [Clostridia bacterium]